MSLATFRLPSLAAALLAAAVLALAPGLAGAHGGHASDQAAPVPPAAPPASVAQPVGGLAGNLLSAPCSGQSGNACCCGAGAGSIGDGRMPLAGCAVATLAAPPAALQSPSSFRRVAPEFRPFPSASPRGPPLPF